MNEHQLITTIGEVKLLSVKPHSSIAKNNGTNLTANIEGTLSLYKNRGGKHNVIHLILRNEHDTVLLAEDGTLTADNNTITFTGMECTYTFQRLPATSKKDPEEKGMDGWLCPHCKTRNNERSIYCEACRTPHWDHEVTCTHCKTTISVRKRTCPVCAIGTRHSIIIDWLKRYDRKWKRAVRKTKLAKTYATINAVVLAISFFLFLITVKACRAVNPIPCELAVLNSVLITLNPLLIVSEVVLVRLYRKLKADAAFVLEQRGFDEADTDDFMPYDFIAQPTKKEL